MTKLEQVARAIQQSDFEDAGIPWEKINPEGRADYLKYARAAVEALRASYDHHGDPTGFIDMLDAVLSEKPE